MSIVICFETWLNNNSVCNVPDTVKYSNITSTNIQENAQRFADLFSSVFESDLSNLFVPNRLPTIYSNSTLSLSSWYINKRNVFTFLHTTRWMTCVQCHSHGFLTCQVYRLWFARCKMQNVLGTCLSLDNVDKYLYLYRYNQFLCSLVCSHLEAILTEMPESNSVAMLTILVFQTEREVKKFTREKQPNKVLISYLFHQVQRKYNLYCIINHNNAVNIERVTIPHEFWSKFKNK
ncbi:hypothetical protein AGLY_013881, partial [Aphis glycines]